MAVKAEAGVSRLQVDHTGRGLAQLDEGLHHPPHGATRLVSDSRMLFFWRWAYCMRMLMSVQMRAPGLQARRLPARDAR